MKRFLSLLLVISMMLSLLPAVTLVSAEETPLYTYDFTTNVFDAEYIEGLNSEVAALKAKYNEKYHVLTAFGTAPNINTEKTSPWAVARTTFALCATSSGKNFSEVSKDGIKLLLYTARYFDTKASNEWFNEGSAKTPTAGNCSNAAIIINIPVAGKYNLDMYNVAYEYGIHADTRFAYVGEKTRLSEADINEIFASADTQKLGRFECNEAHLGTAEKPAKTFVVTVPEGKTGNYVLLFTTPEGTREAHMTTLTAADAISYKSSGYQALSLQKITLSKYVVKLNLTPSLGSDSLEIGEKTDISVSAVTSDGSDLPGAVEYTYTPETDGIVSIDENGHVAALSEGTTSITVSASSGELRGEATLSVTVKKPLPDAVSLTYDFNQLDGKTSHGVTLNAENAGYNNTVGTWAYAGVNTVAITTQQSYGVSVGVNASTPYTAIKLNVPYAGKYSAKLIYHQNKTGGGIGDLFLIPASADASTLAAVTGNTDKITIFEGINFFNTDEDNADLTVNKFDVESDAVNITVEKAGEYYLIFHATGKDERSNSYGLCPHKIIFEGKDTDSVAVMYTEATVSKKEIKAGESSQISVSGYMTDGSVLSGDVVFSYAPDIDGVVSIDEKGKITALSDGRTDITVTASLGERQVTCKTRIIVDSDEKTGYKIKYNIADVSRANASSKPAFTSLGREGNLNQWAYLSKSAAPDTPDWAFAYFGGGIRVAQNRWMAFEINVPVEGTYSLYMEHGVDDVGCDVGVYVSPGEATDSVVNDDYYVGSFNCDSEIASAEFKELSPELSYVSNVTLPKGWNRVAFKVPQGSDYGIVGNIILDGGDDALLIHADMEISSGGKVTLSGIMSDGSEADMSKAKVTYASSNTDAVESPVSGNALIIKDLGTTEITAVIEMGASEPITLKKEFTVTKLPAPFAGRDTQFRFFERGGSWDSTKNPLPQFPEVSDRTEDVRGITYKYTGTTGEGNWQYNSAGPAWTPGKYTVFMYQGIEDKASSYLRLQMPKVGDWVAFDIKIPAAGRYVANLLYTVGNKSASISDIYVLPKDETTDTVEKINSLLIPENYFATVDYLDPSVTDLSAAERELGELEFDAAGEYILVFVKNDGGRGGYINPKMLTLYGVNGMHYANINVEKTELEISLDGDAVIKESTKVNVIATRLDGSAISSDDYEMTIESSDPAIIDAKSDGTLTAMSEGTATISVRIEDRTGKTASSQIEISVVDNTGVKSSVIAMPEKTYVGSKIPVEWNVTLGSGNSVTVPARDITYSYSKNGVVAIDGNGILTGLSVDTVEITAFAEFKSEQISTTATVEVIVDDRKTEPTYYTYDMREAILENVEKFDWAKSTQKTEINYGDKYLEKYMYLYEVMPGEGIPRTTTVGLKNDPQLFTCLYCGQDLSDGYGAGGLSSGFSVDIINRPWQVQCNACKRLFPSNDFESFFELGRDRQGYFDVDRARQLHHEMLFHADGEECACVSPAEEFSDEWYEFYGYGNPDGYLYNELYSELRDPTKETYNKDPHKKDKNGSYLEIDGNRWGVDDGFGYRPGRKSGDVDEVHTYIANFNLQLHNEISDAILHLTRAYLFTGDIKYGRAGAILTDRLADLYPSYDMRTFDGTKYSLNDGNKGTGKTHGNISDAQHSPRFALACDAFFPAIYDEQVISFLSAEANKRGLENDKSTPEKIWDNWESGILDEIFYAIKRRDINGNFGMKQNALAYAAIVRDREPLTSEMIEFIYATDTVPNSNEACTGGNLMTQLIDIVDRDGNNNESAPGYNTILIQNLYEVAGVLAYYNGDENYSLYDNPKFAELFVGLIPTLAVETKTLAIGDYGSTANNAASGYISYYYDAFDHLKDTVYGPKIANYLYMRNGFTVEGLNYGIYYRNPERLQQEILVRIDPEYRQESTNMTGYGLAILRDGVKSKNSTAQTAVNTLRDTWIYYGGAKTHKHKDALLLGMDAYGIDIAPDLGEPEAKTYQPNRYQWVSTTISHNTVLVNEKEQNAVAVSSGVPLHFEDAGKVKVMEAEVPTAYNETSEYRRTAVVVEANDEVSYTVDFFRVKGGTHHSYSFHSQAENAYPAEGLDFTTVYDENGNYVTGAQVAPESGEYPFLTKNEDGELETEMVYMNKGDYLGSYADIQWRVGEDPNSPWTGTFTTVYPRGYSWMGKVRRDTNLESGKFAVEFDVKDYRKASVSSDGVKLRMTQVNDFVPDEVVITAGWVPQRTANAQLPKTLDYVLVNRESDGGNLDTLYTTVFEPYKNTRYISDINAVDVTADGELSENDVVRAVKVTHTSGRTEYIVYATNTGMTYTVTDKDENGNTVFEFKFRGAIGVLSTKNGSVIYRYVNDGDLIGGESDTPARYSGTVAAFSRDLTFDNYIDVNMSCDDLSSLSGRYIYIANDGVRNAAYKIESATRNTDGTVRLDIGTISLIRGHKDTQDVNSGYVYDIAVNQKFTIPMSFKDEGIPEIENPGNVSVSAGSMVTVGVQANSPIYGSNLEYIGTNLPRGASVNAQTGVFTWKPDGSQIGNNHVAITVCDPDGRESTIHFSVTVYGSTTSKPTDSENDSSTSVGGGGGGAAPTDKPGDTTNTDKTDASDQKGNEDASTQPDVEFDVYDEPQFVDLDNHTWASDAINALAVDGIIKGTSASKFSPANNITRADFALLLVRAFNLTSDNTENFADVAASDYFASELAIARNTGIVGGIGDNKFAPRDSITRQDMMVIVYRALTAFGVELSTGNVDYPDFNTVAPYAKDAVSALIGAGLVNGKSGKIAPLDYTTRAEIAVLLKRILDHIR